MSKLLSVVATQILHDEQVRKTISTHIESIIQDGKIDTTDIPEIMLVIMQCTNNLDKFHLSYDELVCVLEEVIIFILDETKLVPTDKRESIDKIIKSSIKLVLLQPKIKSTVSNIWNKVKNLLCCKHKQTQEKEVEQKEVTHTIVATPVAEPVTEPVAEPVTEPVAEPVAEPVTEPVAEPVVEQEEVKQEEVKQESL